MFWKDWQCICPSPLQYTISFEKVLSFRLVLALHLHQYRVGRVKQKKVKLYKTFHLRWRAFCLKNMDERFRHVFTCVVTGPTNAEKPSLLQNLSNMWRKLWHLHSKEPFDVAAAAYCTHLSMVAKWRIDYQIRYRPYDCNTGNSSQKVKYFTWDLYFQPFRILAFFYFRASASLGMSCFNLINKHPHHCTTDDGAKLYVYVTIYTAIRCKDKSGRATQWTPALLITVFFTGS